MHTNCKLLFDKYAKIFIQPDSVVLEIGPDSFPSSLRNLTQEPTAVWHTLDIWANPELTYPSSDPYSFDIASEFYDLVISAQVIEHVKKPWLWLAELARITKVGGLVITINPVSWVYHEAPVDCWRIYPEGMKALYEQAGLTVLTSFWESLETPQYRRYRFGTSLEHQSKARQVLTKVFGRIGFAAERAYDTITIGRKDS